MKQLDIVTRNSTLITLLVNEVEKDLKSTTQEVSKREWDIMWNLEHIKWNSFESAGARNKHFRF